MGKRTRKTSTRRTAIEDTRDTSALIAGICERNGGGSIVVSFVGPTPADPNNRWRATAAGGTSRLYYQDDSRGPRDNAIRAAVLFCEHMGGKANGWDPRDLVIGGTAAGFVFTFKPAPERVPSADKYRQAAASRLIDLGLEAEGDFLIDDANGGNAGRVHVIEQEVPGAWVEVLIWVPAEDI